MLRPGSSVAAWLWCGLVVLSWASWTRGAPSSSAGCQAWARNPAGRPRALTRARCHPDTAAWLLSGLQLAPAWAAGREGPNPAAGGRADIPFGARRKVPFVKHGTDWGCTVSQLLSRVRCLFLLEEAALILSFPIQAGKLQHQLLYLT